MNTPEIGIGLGPNDGRDQVLAESLVAGFVSVMAQHTDEPEAVLLTKGVLIATACFTVPRLVALAMASEDQMQAVLDIGNEQMQDIVGALNTSRRLEALIKDWPEEMVAELMNKAVAVSQGSTRVEIMRDMEAAVLDSM